MKKIIASLVVLAFATTTTQAQYPQRKMRRMHPGQQQMMMQRQLNLSEEQKQKFKILNEDFRKNMMDMRKQDDMTVKEWRNRMANLNKQHRSNLQNVFTQEQKARIEKMRMERRQMAEIDAKARMEKLKLQLSLTDEQTAKLNNQRKEMIDKMKALHENRLMDMMEKREEMRSLMEKRKETMQSILTDEQKKKMQEMRMRQPRKPGKLS
jgi:Spy/CpxP family protein refolding chaperone